VLAPLLWRLCVSFLDDKVAALDPELAKSLADLAAGKHEEAGRTADVISEVVNRDLTGELFWSFEPMVPGPYAIEALRRDRTRAREVLEKLVAKYPGLDQSIDEVYFGCANQAGEDNRNVARMALLLAGLRLLATVN